MMAVFFSLSNQWKTTARKGRGYPEVTTFSRYLLWNFLFGHMTPYDDGIPDAKQVQMRRDTPAPSLAAVQPTTPENFDYRKIQPSYCKILNIAYTRSYGKIKFLQQFLQENTYIQSVSKEM